MADEQRPLDYATPVPPRKSRAWLFAVLLALGLLVMMVLVLFLVRQAPVPRPAPTTPAPPVVAPSPG